jgi:hypothetical protein
VPVPPDLYGDQSASVQGRRKSLARAYLRLYQTAAIKVNGRPVVLRQTDGVMSEGPAGYTGDFQIELVGISDIPDVEIVQDVPLKATVLAIMGKMTVGE